MADLTATCQLCSGTGQIAHTLTEPHGLGDTTSHWTTLCQCRSDLPPRHGKAAWWTYGKPVSWQYESVCEYLGVRITAKQELPVSSDGYPLHRTLNNCYFCTGAAVEITHGDDVLTTRDLRTLAAFLVECADKIDAMDKPVEEPTHV